MPIPPTPTFERILSSLTITRPPSEENFGSIVLLDQAHRLGQVPTRLGETVPGVRTPAVTLWFAADTEVDITALVRRVEDELRNVGHASSIQIACVILGLFSAIPPSPAQAVERLNGLLAQLMTADVSLFLVLPGKAPSDFSLRLIPFTLGRLNVERLAYRCRRAKCDYFERFSRDLTDTFALEREPTVTKVIPWADSIKTDPAYLLHDQYLADPVYLLLDQYFAELSGQLFERFFEEIPQAQHLLVAAGAPLVDERVLRNFFGSRRLAIFLKVSRRAGGWVVPGALAHMSLDLAGVDKRIPEVARMLRNNFQLDALTEAEVHRAIATYARFLFRACRHERDGNRDEAFLHCVIALDLLFGGTDESTKSVTRRAACVIHRAKSLSLEAAIHRVRALYDIRSKYVHEGKPVKEAVLTDVQEICREVLWSLLRVQRCPEAQGKGVMDWWVKRLDYLCSAIEAGETPPLEEWARAGIA